MGNDVLEPLSKELDDMAIRMLRLMKDYIDVKLNLESFIKAGSLNLAKSRYIMGNRNVSVLQLPSEESSEFTASTRVIQTDENGSEDNLCFELSKVSLQDIKESGCEVKSRKNKNKDSPKKNEDHTPEEEEESTNDVVIPDPLKWFGVLVPQNMRQAQSSFSKAIEYSIQCANIQLEIEKLRKNYIIKIKEKKDLDSKRS